jgi:hypothetical protein
VKLPDSSTIQSTKEGNIPLHSSLSPTATKVHIFDNLTNFSLLYIGQLCDDDCTAVLDKRFLRVFKNDSCIITGRRNRRDGLWDVSIPVSDSPDEITKISSCAVNAIIRKDTSKKELAEYLYACCGSPSVSTFVQAIRKGNFITWPGIDTINFIKDLRPSVASAEGHLNQERKNLQSTSKQIDLDELFPPQPVQNEPLHESVSLLVPYESTNKAYHDLTGQFPHKSSRGYEYLLMTYDFDSNAILAEPLQNRTGLEIKRAWTSTYTKLATRGSIPKLYIMDNEISGYLKSALKKHNCTYQLVPPHVHRRNAAERAIRTFKEHFLAILASCDPNFPITEWDRLLPQCLLTLNLLRNSRVNPKLSAHAYLFGNFDFNKTPLAPPGTRVVIHTKPDKRAFWGFHGKDSWYIGPSINHYRCLKIIIPTLLAKWTCTQYNFFHQPQRFQQFLQKII